MKDPPAARPQKQTVNAAFLVQSKERKMARTGSAYLDLELLNAKGVARGKLWDCDQFRLDFEVADIVRVVGDVEEFQGSTQIRVRQVIRLAEGEVNLLDLFPRSRRDPEEMFAALLDRLRQMPEGPLRALLLALMEDPEIAAKYKLAPAAMTYHHAYLGGLLEHVLSLVELADRVLDHYPELRRELVLAGLLLHDIGKIEELGYKTGIRYTTRGQLLGHIAIGIEIVNEKIRALADFPGTLKDQIEHIILAHHGELQFGSPKEPAFPEALVVHLLDNLDSKLQSMRAQYAADKDRAGDFTARNPALKRELLKIE